jgi:methylated-DNA-[protein]-cysteine S-methyltransferase
MKPRHRKKRSAPSMTSSPCSRASSATSNTLKSIYEVARAIPPGKRLSYGEVAERLGDRNLARDVAQALGQNPVPIIVPCHRVMAAGRKTGGFSAPGGVQTKLKLLSIEGAQLEEAPMLFDRLPLVAQRRSRG